ncbi:aha1 domain-containing protein [Wolffia australiana]
MAKFGEGDKRWIVAERADGTNVHNWHWAERDCLEWSRNQLSALLAQLPVLDGDGGLKIRTKTLDKLEGEAYVNIRKGKIIPGYELSLSLSWEGEAIADPTVKIEGSVEVPYLADENADEDPDLRITVRGNDAGPLERRLKEAFIARGKPLVLDKLRLFVRSLAAGGPAKDELEAKKPKLPPPASAVPAKTEAAAETMTTTMKAVQKDKDGFRTITMTEKFYCRARNIFEILMDENRWKGFTQSNAKISKEIGGAFSLFDGSITGVNEDLKEEKLILQKWRFASWPDGVHSTVRMTFDEPETGVTIVKLIQTNVPLEDRYGNATVVENTERGWRDLIFHKIRAVFGFGV